MEHRTHTRPLTSSNQREGDCFQALGEWQPCDFAVRREYDSSQSWGSPLPPRPRYPYDDAGIHSRVMTATSRRKTTMHRASTITMGVLFAGLSAFALSSQAAPAGGMVALTDGTDMNNFVKAGDAHWRIAERANVGGKGDGLLVTKQAYDKFRLPAAIFH